MDEITPTIDTESTKAQADVNISAVGASKTRPAAQFNNVHSWIEEAERYLGIDPKDHYIDNDFDAMKYEKDIYEAMESSIEIATGTKPASVDSVSITSRGIMPDAKSFGCFYRASFDDFSIDAGEEMIVNIGKLFSDNDRLSATTVSVASKPPDLRHTIISANFAYLCPRDTASATRLLPH